MSRIRFVICLSLVAMFSQQACAAPGDLLFKITAPDPQAGAWFGYVLSEVDGNILVGEINRFLGPARGRAYLFDGQTGALRTTFDNPEPTNQDVFADALAGGDGRVFVSTNGVVPRVYRFDAASGKHLQTIHEPDFVGGSNFGSGLAYGAGNLLVSNPSFGLGPQLRTVGRAYLFDAGTGGFLHPVPNPEPKAGDAFGIGIRPLSLAGNLAIVGAQDDDLPGDDQPDGDSPGRVWVFDRVSGETVFTLENPRPQKPAPLFIPDFFGATVAANKHGIVVGARNEDTNDVEDSGAVYVFDTNTGTLRHTLFSPQLEANGDFGRSLAITPEGNVLVGAQNTTVNGIDDAGHIYLFDGLTGSLLLDIPNPEPSVNSAFGWEVASLGNRIIVSAIDEDVGGLPNSGAVYVFEGIPEPSSLVLGAVVALALALVQIIRRFR